MNNKWIALLALLVCGSSFAQPVIDLEISPSGAPIPGVFGAATQRFVITATNTGASAGTYDIELVFAPGVEILFGSALIAYQAGGTDAEDAGPVSAGGLGFNGNTPLLLVDDEAIGAGNTEFWTVDLEIVATFVLVASPRGRGEGGDFQMAVIDTISCDASSSPPLPNFGLHLTLTGSTSETTPINNVACADIPTPDMDYSMEVGPAVLNDYGNYNVVYNIEITNEGPITGFYGVRFDYDTGPGIEPVMSFLTCLSPVNCGNDTVFIENGPAVVGNPAPLNRGGEWVFSQFLEPTETNSWQVVSAFDVDPALVTADGSDCDTGNTGGSSTGFSATVGDVSFIRGGQGLVDGDGDPTPADNTQCTALGLPTASLPDIDITTTANGPAKRTGAGIWTVEYTVTATNNGTATGDYDLVKRFEPGEGISYDSATFSYEGGETQSGVPSLAPGTNSAFGSGEEYCFTDQCLFPDITYFTLVVGESLAAGASESWNVTANFSVVPADLDNSQLCNPGGDSFDQGFTSITLGNISVLDERNENYVLAEDTSNNSACADFFVPQIPVNSLWMKVLLALCVLAAGLYITRRRLYISAV